MTYIKHSRGKVTRASIQNLTVQNPVLKCIATRCKALTHLEIHWGLNISLVESAPALGSLKHLVVAADISLDAISQILSLCGSLKKAQFLSVTTKYPAKWKGDLSNLCSLSINATRHNSDKRSALLKLVRIVHWSNGSVLIILGILDTDAQKYRESCSPRLVLWQSPAYSSP